MEHKSVIDCDNSYFTGVDFSDQCEKLSRNLYVSKDHLHYVLFYTGHYLNLNVFRSMISYRRDYVWVLQEKTFEEQNELGICYINVTESKNQQIHLGLVLEIVDTNWKPDDIHYEYLGKICSGKVHGKTLTSGRQRKSYVIVSVGCVEWKRRYCLISYIAHLSKANTVDFAER